MMNQTTIFYFCELPLYVLQLNEFNLEHLAISYILISNTFFFFFFVEIAIFYLINRIDLMGIVLFSTFLSS